MERIVTPDELNVAGVDRAMEQARLRAGAALRCGAGCFGCCLGPFPITQVDAERLRRGWADLSARDAGAAERMKHRAAEVAARLPEREAGDWLFEPEWQMEPCPVLDLESGRCELYEWRPVACRTYGPSVRVDGEPLRTCPLNYQGWTPQQIEAARVDVEVPRIDGGGLTTVAGALLSLP